MTTTHETGPSAGATGAGTTDQAKQAASTAAERAQDVAGTATQELGSVAGEATAHAQDLLGEVRGQAGQLLGEQAGTQRDNLVSTLSSVSSDLRSMSEGEGGAGLAGTLAREVADRAQQLQHRLDGRDPAELLDDVRRFARQRPGLFLAGALVAGIAAGRLARGAQSASSSGPTSGTPTAGTTPTQVPAPRGTADGLPVPTTPTPPVTPAVGGHGDPLTDPLNDPLSDPMADPAGGGPLGEPGHGLPRGPQG